MSGKGDRAALASFPVSLGAAVIVIDVVAAVGPHGVVDVTSGVAMVTTGAGTLSVPSSRGTSGAGGDACRRGEGEGAVHDRGCVLSSSVRGSDCCGCGCLEDLSRGEIDSVRGDTLREAEGECSCSRPSGSERPAEVRDVLAVRGEVAGFLLPWVTCDHDCWPDVATGDQAFPFVVNPGGGLDTFTGAVGRLPFFRRRAVESWLCASRRWPLPAASFCSEDTLRLCFCCASVFLFLPPVSLIGDKTSGR